jgi:hypothetical protein
MFQSALEILEHDPAVVFLVVLAGQFEHCVISLCRESDFLPLPSKNLSLQT